MATDKHKKVKDPNTSAHDQAEKDMEKDPDLSDTDPTDDLDEGELANRDNSDEEALDYLERPRSADEGHGGHADGDKGHGGNYSGKGREK
jgi:hypothetical protein